MSDNTPSCRLYLVIPPDPGPGAAGVLAEALDAGDVACVLLTARADGIVDRTLAGELMAAAQARDAAFMVADDLAAAAAIGADGVHIEGDEALYEEARGMIGGGAIVGAACGLSRHRALTLGERGADYVAFAGNGDAEALDELISWWAEVVEVPCVAWEVASAEEARAMARIGADFVALAPALWADGPAKAVRAFADAVARERTAA